MCSLGWIQDNWIWNINNWWKLLFLLVLMYHIEPTDAFTKGTNGWCMENTLLCNDCIYENNFITEICIKEKTMYMRDGSLPNAICFVSWIHYSCCTGYTGEAYTGMAKLVMCSILVPVSISHKASYHKISNPLHYVLKSSNRFWNLTGNSVDAPTKLQNDSKTQNTGFMLSKL